MTDPIQKPEISSLPGLTDEQVMANRKSGGQNELPSARKRTLLDTLIDVMREPMFLLLIACATIYFIIGDMEEALILLFSVLIIIVITVLQEGKTERALDALRDLSSPRALVVRNGRMIRIAGRDVVTGDIIALREGDRISADSVVLWHSNLKVDESLLTGESLAVDKTQATGIDRMERPGGDRTPFVYSGSLVVQGEAYARVLAVGIQSEMGKIGKSLQIIESEMTSLQRETARIVKIFFALGFSVCAALVLLYGITRGDWLTGILSGLTLAISVLPEEFPVVLTIFLALGAYRISKSSVLARKMSAVETLGAATILCVDKTGTLTENRMTVDSILIAEQLEPSDPHHSAGHDPSPDMITFFESCPVLQRVDFSDPSPALRNLIRTAVLACRKDPFDPMERELISLYGEFHTAGNPFESVDLMKEYPLLPEFFAMTNVWKHGITDEIFVCAKGAPEAVAELCGFDGSVREALQKCVQKMSVTGLRILGVASGRLMDAILPEKRDQIEYEFLGLVGFIDPVRETVPDAIRECYTAGIRVSMITGDYAGTARTIAERIGLRNRDRIITGKELDEFDEERLAEAIGDVSIFSRVIPEQKLKIIQALKKTGEIVAMTGDGVNDAPALKAAHIGIAMGQRGTDVAREASSIVLVNDDFSSLVKSIRIGRRIYDNLRKAMAYVIAVHVPMAGLSLVPVLIGEELIFFPVHIVFWELIIDPACSIVFEAEPEEEEIMRRKPRDPRLSLFGARLVVLGLLQGFTVLLISTGVYLYSLQSGHTTSETRTLTFITIIAGNLSLILANRSWSTTILKSMRRSNRALWWIMGGATFFLILITHIPFLQRLFLFETPDELHMVAAFALGLAGVIWFELIKIFFRKKLL